MSMKTVEYRMQGAAAMLFVVCLPLFGAGYGAVFVGRVIAGRLREERRHKRCEKIREQRMEQRIALREARKNERRGENWHALRNAKGTFPSCIKPAEAHIDTKPTGAHANAKSTEMRTDAKANDASSSVLKNGVFENTVACSA